MKVDDDIWFSHSPNGEIGITIGQFIATIENHTNWSNDEKKDYLVNHVKGQAKTYVQTNFKESSKWPNIKSKLLKEFKCKMNLWTKVEFRRTLLQMPNENVRDFYQRCVSCQYILCDDIIDAVIERDILFSFLLGLQKSIYEELTKIDQVMELQMCLAEVEKLESINKNIDVKTEDIKLEHEYISDGDEKAMDCYDDNVEDVEECIDESLFEGSVDNLKEDPDLISNSDDDDCEKDPDFDFEDHVEKLKIDKKHQIKSQLKQHQHKQHAIDGQPELPEMKSVTCRFCGVKSKSKEINVYHIKKMHQELCMKCDFDQCSRIWYSNDEPYLLDFHKIVEHGEKGATPNAYLCDKCKKSFSFKTLLDHIKRYHYHIKPHLCDLCGRAFKSKSDLKTHIEHIHTKSKIYECRDCNLTFDTFGKIKYHKIHVHYTQLHVCEICGKSFPTKYKLKFHNRLHINMAVSCDECGGSYRSRQLLKKHQQNMHSVRNLKCPFSDCEASFSTKKGLKSHIESHKPKEYNYSCSSCPKKFSNNQALQKHIKAIHLGLKELKCDKCDYTCSYKNSLDVHKSSVHEGIMFKCHLCTKEYNRKSNLDVHKHNSHGILMPGQKNKVVKVNV